MRISKLIVGGLVGLALTASSAGVTNDHVRIKNEFRFTRPNVIVYSNNNKTTISNTNYTTLLSDYLKSTEKPDLFKTKAIMHGYMSLHKRNGFEYKGDGTWVRVGDFDDLSSKYWVLEGEYNKRFEDIIIKFAKQEKKGSLK